MGDDAGDGGEVEMHGAEPGPAPDAAESPADPAAGPAGVPLHLVADDVVVVVGHAGPAAAAAAVHLSFSSQSSRTHAQSAYAGEGCLISRNSWSSGGM